MISTVIDPFMFSLYLLNYASRVEEEVHLVDGVLFPQTNQITMKQ